MLFKQRNGNTAKTEEAGWSQKVDLELAEHSVVSVSRKKQGALMVSGTHGGIWVSKHPVVQTCTFACCRVIYLLQGVGLRGVTQIGKDGQD